MMDLTISITPTRSLVRATFRMIPVSFPIPPLIFFLLLFSPRVFFSLFTSYCSFLLADNSVNKTFLFSDVGMCHIFRTNINPLLHGVCQLNYPTLYTLSSISYGIAGARTSLSIFFNFVACHTKKNNLQGTEWIEFLVITLCVSLA
jgi:hypothetical protein